MFFMVGVRKRITPPLPTSHMTLVMPISLWVLSARPLKPMCMVESIIARPLGHPGPFLRWGPRSGSREMPNRRVDRAQKPRLSATTQPFGRGPATAASLAKAGYGAPSGAIEHPLAPHIFCLVADRAMEH